MGCRAIEGEINPQIWPIKESNGCLAKIIVSCGVKKSHEKYLTDKGKFQAFQVISFFLQKDSPTRTEGRLWRWSLSS
jgi:hypothetical protein